MKQKFTLLLLLLGLGWFVTFSQPLGAVLLISQSKGKVQSDCTRTSVGLTPIDDLGSGLYQGYVGGLYPNGNNTRPETHNQAGLSIAQAAQPLDPAGQPDPQWGKFVLLSIGMSNTNQEFGAFKQMVLTRPELVLINGAVGGADAATIANPNAAYWANVDNKLANSGLTPAQVQFIWLKEALMGPTGNFLQHAQLLQSYLTDIIHIIHDRYPNVKIVYLASRTYAGYSDTPLNPEPYAYESAFSVKWLIEAQINGDPTLNYDSNLGPVTAPWLSWGPYLWADGLAPRNDGLSWLCSDFEQADGVHPSADGEAKVAYRLLTFFHTDPTAAPWFWDIQSLVYLPTNFNNFSYNDYLWNRQPWYTAFVPTEQ